MKLRLPLLILLIVHLAGGVLAAAAPRAKAAVTTAPLTAAGHEGLPVYSPDGSRIAFVSARYNEFGDVFVMNADGSEQTQLTTGPHGYIWTLSWSPGGAALLFAADPTQTPGGSDVFVIAADGSAGAVNLTNTPDVADSSPQWSPDGARIVFARERRIAVMNADGTGVTNLTSGADIDVPAGQHDLRDAADRQAVWSPDGREIAFLRIYPLQQHSHLYVMHADGSNVTMMKTGEGLDHADPAWAPNGKAIAVGAGEHGASGAILVVGRADGRLTNVSAGVASFGPAVWSPNGRQIAFPGDNGDLYIVGPDGSGLANLTNSQAVWESGPLSWSRNGAQLVFLVLTRVYTSPDEWTTASDIYALSPRAAKATSFAP